jgi:hypothetical protein
MMKKLHRAECLTYFSNIKLSVFNAKFVALESFEGLISRKNSSGGGKYPSLKS